MQPPPQTVPAGAGGPPPVGTARNVYWRNSPFSRRANVPVSAALAPVQPVTDPFAFGRQTPQGSPLGNPSKGNPPVMPGPPPSVYPQPAVLHKAPSHAGDNPHELRASLPAPVSQPGINSNTFSNVLASSPGHDLNSTTEMQPNAEFGLHTPSAPLHYSPGMMLENSLGGHVGVGPAPNRPLSIQEVNRDPSNPSAVPATTPFFPFAETPPSQWRLVQGNTQPQVRNYAPYAEPSSQNAVHSMSHPSAGGSSLHLAPGHQQSAMQAPLLGGSDKNGQSGSAGGNPQVSSLQPENMVRQSVEMTNTWLAQPYPEQFYPQSLLPDCGLVNPTTQESNLKNQSQAASETSGGHVPSNPDSGTISMFFKGDEAENEEILSSEINDLASKADFDACHQSSGLVYHPSLPPQQVVANIQSQAPVSTGSANERVLKGMDVQYFLRTVSSPHEAQTVQHSVHVTDDNTDVSKARGNVAPQYENVENLECVQNQEVLPNEPQNNPLSSSVGSDLYRYGLPPGPSLPKNTIVSHAEGGPNLEAPDSLPHPIRPDSVSSNYSNVSHRSISSSARPQELDGTFIQQESGKPDEETSASFFKQIDCSPSGGDTSEPNISKNYHRNLSQPPTPSPPKPTGIFQTSANSSFEPVRSHGVGVKPAEIDQAKMVVELRENHPNKKNAKKTTALTAASPGNLEQPPDNLETLFIPQAHPLPLVVTAEHGNVLQPGVGPGVENVQAVSEKRPSTRAQGAVKKCDSPATTLWAHNELPNFGGNVLLAPAAPAVYVPAKQTVEIIQPPEEGLSHQQPDKPGSVTVQPSQDGNVSSENLENPPKMGEEEALQSQASSGYASLLSSPPTESLQNQPVLIAQPNQSYNLAQPINFSISLSNQLRNENNQLLKDPGVGDKPVAGLQTLHAGGIHSGENVSLPVVQAGSLANAPPPTTNLSNANLLQSPSSASEIAPNQSTSLLMQLPSQIPLNVAPEGQKNVNSESLIPELATMPGANSSVPPGTSLPSGNASVLVPPANSMVPSNNFANHSNSKEEAAGALDFTVTWTLERSNTSNSGQVQNPSLSGGPAYSQQPANRSSQVGLETHDKQHFYQQVTKDVQHQVPSDRATQGTLPSQQQMQAAPMPQAVPSGHSSVPSNYQVAPGSKPMQAPQQHDNQVPSNRHYSLGPQEASSTQPPARAAQPSSDKQPLPVPSSSALTTSAVATTTQPVMPATQQEPQCPLPPQTPQDAFGPPQNPYYYYRHPYDAYQQPYPPSYPAVDPRAAAHLYYSEDVYGQYDPRYRHYDSTAYVESGGYRYAEPERPSSRASHCSERPPSRQGYKEDYYNTKSGWNDYYADYYANPYDYGDPNRWDPYSSAYDPRYRDPRNYDQRYWYDAEHNLYQKREPYPYSNRQEQYEDHWRYDPRFTGSFDDESEPRRDPYSDEFDRRSMHSERSSHSLHSSRSVHSSFSSRSQQSQLYRSNNDLTANVFETTTQPVSLHADYPYGGYATTFDGQQTFTDYGYSGETGWPTVEQVPSRPMTPEKFSVPHTCARFGPGGHLIKVLPNLPSEGQPALVEIHSMETMLQHSPEQEEMRAFPGPLAKEDTHKVDVINFAQNKATQCFQNDNLIDKESASLLWEFIVLLCRQNGTVVGTDIAELLLRDHKTVWLPGKSPNEANLIDFTNEALEQAEEESGEAQISYLTDSLITAIDSIERETERFRELLLYGRKKDALESAMKHGLWGHALLLASKMDSRTHARVMTRFANSLPINDPLQTVYQLMSGRMPAASTCCGDEKWGDWRPHLAMVLSNLTNNMDLESRTISTMGDTLASKGLLDAAHFCYMMAQVGFGVYTKKTTKIVLIGSNHSLPFFKFATNEAIQRTEAYEYAQSLGTQPGSLPNFQVFKFIYACRLAELGLAAQAFHYCEVISKTVLRDPQYYSPVLINQLVQVSSQLRLFDPQIKEKPEQETFIEPTWLVRLRHLDGQIKEGIIAYSADRSTPQQYASSTPSSELDHISQCDGAGGTPDMGPGTENQLLASLLPNMVQPMQSVQLMPSAPHTILDGSSTTMPPPPQQDPGGTVPFYLVAPTSIGPGPSFAPPGFPHQCGVAQPPLYLSPAVPPGGPPPLAADAWPEERINQETAMQRLPQESPGRKNFPEQREDDFYGKMASMAPGRRSRSTSQSSAHMGYGRRSRTTSESSTHSVGRERSNSAVKQPSPPPPSIPEGKETKKDAKKEVASRKSGANWFRWLMGKGKNEAHLPDDKNKSIVWDEKKQRWVNLDEPEEESKPPPPPPTGFPKVPQAAPPGPGGPPGASVNMFSRRAAGSRARYVDVLNPSGAKSSSAVPAPSDLFAPLAPMPIPANLFVPNSVPEESQPTEGSGAVEQTPATNQANIDAAAAAEPQYLNSAMLPPGSELPASNPDGSQSGELSRSSSMSSLSREVSQHFNQPLSSVPPSGGPPTGTVQFYNPSHFAHSPAPSGSSRMGRIGQRKYPTLK
ncbi:protein transport protein Sec16A isoform X1 [Alligator sinensis]|uniref:Protein transport protein sec16 n=1 Tax=Alligator sinensis TaxID=38654 RepID=A0A1U7RQ44_ALLSI|nr:protein transport protein Sec16A isoform X1 [Alligator sinensis]